MEGLLNILSKIGFDWQVALANLVNFMVIFFVLKKFAFGPIGKIIRERQEKIEKGLENAKVSAAILEKANEEQDRVLTEARIEADKLFQKTKQEAEAKKSQILEAARVEAVDMVNNGKKMLESEKKKMMEESRGEIIGVAIRATEKLIGRKVDGSLDEKTLQELTTV